MKPYCYRIPVFYISATPNSFLETCLQEQGFSNIIHWPLISFNRIPTLDSLLAQNMISRRLYLDMKHNKKYNKKYNKKNNSSLNSIAECLTHYTLWDWCLQKELPDIIVVSQYVYFDTKMTQMDTNMLQDCIINRKMLVSPSEQYTKNNVTLFEGVSLYYLPIEACKMICKTAYPIDVSIDEVLSLFAHIQKMTCVYAFAKDIRKIPKSYCLVI